MLHRCFISRASRWASCWSWRPSCPRGIRGSCTSAAWCFRSARSWWPFSAECGKTPTAGSGTGSWTAGTITGRTRAPWWWWTTTTAATNTAVALPANRRPPGPARPQPPPRQYRCRTSWRPAVSITAALFAGSSRATSTSTSARGTAVRQTTTRPTAITTRLRPTYSSKYCWAYKGCLMSVVGRIRGVLMSVLVHRL